MTRMILEKLKKMFPKSERIKRQLIYAKQNEYRRFAESVPTQENWIVFSSFAGGSYSCSPRAIYEYMLQSDDYRDFEFIWILKNIDEFQFLKKNPRTQVVKYYSKEFWKVYARAKYWVNNYTMSVYLYPKKDQVYIHTWHGKPIKKIGCDVNGSLTEWNNYRDILFRYTNDVKKMSFLLSCSDFYSDCMRTAFRFDLAGNPDVLVKTGYPRNDSLFKFTQADVDRLKQRMGIPVGKKVILYTPTWRPEHYIKSKGFEYNQECIDFTKLKRALGDEYIILFRTHHMTVVKDVPEGVINMSDWPDVNEVFIVSDLMIGDYSGTVYDFAVLKRPMVFYLYDREKYEKLPGVYMDLDELPGPIVYHEEELGKAIVETLANFQYDEKYRRFNQKYNPLESIDCARRTVELCIPPKRKESSV